MTDWYAARYDARQLVQAPLAPCGTPGADGRRIHHAWVDINRLPDPERLVCYRCGAEGRRLGTWVTVDSPPANSEYAGGITPSTVGGTDG